MRAEVIPAREKRQRHAYGDRGGDQEGCAVAPGDVSAPALDEGRGNPTVTDTYESDDTFAHTEGQKIRGGRFDLIV